MPVHHLHDGPWPHSFQRWEELTRREELPSRPLATLAALQWAADREGQSYGRFILGLTAADQSRIQAEYETFQAEETQKKAARHRVATSPAAEE